MSNDEEMLGYEIGTWGLKPIVDVADEMAGKEVIDRLFAEWKLDVRGLVARRGWTNLHFLERLSVAVVDICGPDLVDRAAAQSMSPKYLGAMYPLVWAFGSPWGMMDRMIAAGPRFNKIRVMRLERMGPSWARILSVPTENATPQGTRLFCQFAAAQMKAVPAIFGCPAESRHDHCIIDGAPECIYDIVWQEQPNRLGGRWPWVAGGGATSVLAGLLLQAPWPALIGFGGLGGAVGLLGWLNLRQHQQLADQLRSVDMHSTALAQSLKDTEDRFAELVEAKRDVEEKVKVRTADLSERSAQLSQALDELRELNEAKTKFFSHISHELRTPLTLILGPLKALESAAHPTAVVQQQAATMSRNANQLLRMINELLELARAEAGYATLSRRSASLNELADHCASSVREHAASRGLSFETELQTPHHYDIDVRWIERAIDNLLSNAMGHARTGIVLRTRLESVQGQPHLLIEVQDDGDGVPPEYQETIFMRYVRGPDTTRVGSGLGLAIVREAARLHGGQASVQSEAGEGACFRVQIPAQASARVEAETEPETTETGRAMDRDGPHPDAPCVLVVEDHDDLRAFMADVLSARYAVVGATNGLDGANKARAVVPDVIVTDVAMEGMDGLELTRRLRQDPITQDIPIVVVTARGEPDDAAKGFDAGANDYIPKPFHVVELLARVDAQLQLRHTLGRAAHHHRVSAVSDISGGIVRQLADPVGILLQTLPELQRAIDDDRPMDAHPIASAATLAIQALQRVQQVAQRLEYLSGERGSARTHRNQVCTAAAELARAKHPGLSITIDLDATEVPIKHPVPLTHALVHLFDEVAATHPSSHVSLTSPNDPNGELLLTVVTEVAFDKTLAPRLDPSLRRHDTSRSKRPNAVLPIEMAIEAVGQAGATLHVQRSDDGTALFEIRALDIVTPADTNGSVRSATSSPMATEVRDVSPRLSDQLDETDHSRSEQTSAVAASDLGKPTHALESRVRPTNTPGTPAPRIEHTAPGGSSGRPSDKGKQLASVHDGEESSPQPALTTATWARIRREPALPEERVFGTELNAWALRPVIDVADETIGADAVEELFRQWGHDIRALTVKSGWTTYAFAEHMLDCVVELCGPDALRRAAALSVSPRYLGAMAPLLRTVSSPWVTLMQIERAAPRLNKVRTQRVVRVGRRHVQVIMTPTADAPPQKGKPICDFSGTQMKQVPEFFGYPGKVEHHQCVVDGHHQCVFDITWEDPGSRRALPVVGAVGGAALGTAAAAGAIATTFVAGAPVWIAGAVAGTVGGWLAGRWYRQQPRNA